MSFLESKSSTNSPPLYYYPPELRYEPVPTYHGPELRRHEPVPTYHPPEQQYDPVPSAPDRPAARRKARDLGSKKTSCITLNKCLLALYIIALVAVVVFLVKAPTATLSDGGKIATGLSVGLAPPLLYLIYNKLGKMCCRDGNAHVYPNL